MAQTDSLDKIIGTYFACVTDEPFEYKGKHYKPKPLKISPLIFRGFTCPPGCGGCCPRFSLDYLPEELIPVELELVTRKVEFNGETFIILSDLQQDHRNHHCRNLNMDTGRCGIHGRQPFSCDFELMRFIEFQDVDHPNYITQKLFGRGWQMLRVDGERGALCEMTDPTYETINEVLRKLLRLQQWTDNFGLQTKIPEIIDYVETGPHRDSALV